MAKQAPDTDKGRDTVRDQTRFQHVSTCSNYYKKHLHLHLVILQTLLSKATYNWGIHKAINLEETNAHRGCPLFK